MDVSSQSSRLATSVDPASCVTKPVLKLVAAHHGNAATQGSGPKAAGPKEAGRVRVRIGDTAAELRDFPDQRAVQFKAPASAVLLIVPIEGKAVVVTEAGREWLDAGTAMLLARAEPATVVWLAGSRGLVLHLPRFRLQALASAQFGGARRLASVQRTVAIETGGDMPDALSLCLAEIAQPTGGDDAERRLHRSLIVELAGLERADEIFPQSRSITQAMRQIEEHCERAWDAASLAAATGVTMPTLRRGFRSCLGTSIGTYTQEARLKWAHARLASGHDSRPMAAIAHSVGYRSASAFSRAYQTRFGEPPSQTRLRAIFANNGSEIVKQT